MLFMFGWTVLLVGVALVIIGSYQIGNPIAIGKPYTLFGFLACVITLFSAMYHRPKLSLIASVATNIFLISSSVFDYTQHNKVTGKYTGLLAAASILITTQGFLSLRIKDSTN
jgi:hypothetical protein